LTLDKYLRVIKENQAQSGVTREKDGKQFVVLRYNPKDLPDFNSVGWSKGLVSEMELWIEKGSSLLVKASLKITGESADGKKVDVWYSQLFDDYNVNFNIAKPKEVFDLGKAQVKSGR
jgi:hypothetical protein